MVKVASPYKEQSEKGYDNMSKRKVTNINTNGSHYLIHVFFKNFEMQEIHCTTKKELDKKVNEICNDKNVHDFVIYLKIDFDLEEEE